MRKPYLRGRGPHFPILDTVKQYPFEPGYVVFMMPSPKRLSIKVGDIVIADTIEGLVMQESDHLPVYYFPIKDVHEEFLMASATTDRIAVQRNGDALLGEYGRHAGRGCRLALSRARYRLPADRRLHRFLLEQDEPLV